MGANICWHDTQQRKSSKDATAGECIFFCSNQSEVNNVDTVTDLLQMQLYVNDSQYLFLQVVPCFLLQAYFCKTANLQLKGDTSAQHATTKHNKKE